ncbi:unnamed protein product [Brassica oleracea var. botrytis]
MKDSFERKEKQSDDAVRCVEKSDHTRRRLKKKR